MLTKTFVKSCKQAFKVTTAGCNPVYFDELLMNFKDTKNVLTLAIIRLLRLM